jgi:hypothetical protein
MKRTAVSGLVGLIILLLALLSWALIDAAPNTQELETDLGYVRDDIKQAVADDNKYAGGMIKSMIELRLQILKQTEAMLIQRKLSLVRRIAVSYLVDGHALAPVTDGDLNDIISDLEQAQRRLDQSFKDAQKYSSGLAQAMALVTVQTDQLSVSQLRLKFYAAKHGLPLVIPANRSDNSPAQPNPGTVAKDRDAL